MSVSNERKVFIPRIPLNCEADDLESVFSKFGNLCECVVKQSQDKSRKFAFLTYTNADEANKAVQANPHNVQDSKVYANLSLKKEDRSARSGQGYSSNNRNNGNGVRGRRNNANENRSNNQSGVCDNEDDWDEPVKGVRVIESDRRSPDDSEKSKFQRDRRNGDDDQSIKRKKDHRNSHRDGSRRENDGFNARNDQKKDNRHESARFSDIKRNREKDYIKDKFDDSRNSDKSRESDRELSWRRDSDGRSERSTTKSRGGSPVDDEHIKIGDIPTVQLSSDDIDYRFLISHISDSFDFVFSKVSHLSDLLNLAKKEVSSLKSIKNARVGDVVLYNDGQMNFRVEIVRILNGRFCRGRCLDMGGEDDMKICEMRPLNRVWKSRDLATHVLKLREFDDFELKPDIADELRKRLENLSFTLSFVSCDCKVFDGKVDDGQKVSEIVAKVLRGHREESTSSDGSKSPPLTLQRCVVEDMSDEEMEFLRKELTKSTLRGDSPVYSRNRSSGDETTPRIPKTSSRTHSRNSPPKLNGDERKMSFVELYAKNDDSITKIEQALKSAEEIRKMLKYVIRR